MNIILQHFAALQTILANFKKAAFLQTVMHFKKINWEQGCKVSPTIFNMAAVFIVINGLLQRYLSLDQSGSKISSPRLRPDPVKMPPKTETIKKWRPRSTSATTMMCSCLLMTFSSQPEEHVQNNNVPVNGVHGW